MKIFRHYSTWLIMRGRGEWLIYPPLDDQHSYAVRTERFHTFEAARTAFATGGRS